MPLSPIPYAPTGVFLGAEFPSLIGGLVGLAIVVTAANVPFLVLNQMDFWKSEDKAASRMASSGTDLDDNNQNHKNASMAKAWAILRAVSLSP